MGSLSLLIMVLLSPPPTLDKNGTKTLAIYSTSFPIFQFRPDFKRLELCQNHYIISSLGGKINHTVPINTNLCSFIEVSKFVSRVKEIKILLKSVKYKNIYNKLGKDEYFRRLLLKRNPNYHCQ